MIVYYRGTGFLSRNRVRIVKGSSMAMVKSVKGLSFAGLTDSGKWIMMDTKKEAGGIAEGPTPMELVLLSLMACSGMDVVSILEKKKFKISSFEMSEIHERAETYPKVYTKIHMTYKVDGEGIDPEAVKKAVSLSIEKYCSVHAMLKGSVDITYGIEVNGFKID